MKKLRHRLCRVCLVGTIMLGAGTALASRHNLDPGLSGGPFGWGANCSNCHVFETGFGSVEIIGLPAAYEPNGTYDLIVRVQDEAQFGAGFQFSAEADEDLVGVIIQTDEINTQLIDAGGGRIYIGHSGDGVNDSIDNWEARGRSVDYTFQWQAPPTDVGPIRFFAAGNAIDDDHWLDGDHTYLKSVTVEMTVDGDGDDDGDNDLADFSAFQTCFDEIPLSEYCELFDLDPDGVIDLNDYSAYLDAVTGPTALGPSAYRHANAARGARLYDKWWVENGADEPTGDHPLYPPEGQKSGSTTYRCKECHGWDYKGKDGAYGQGSHYTGIKGVYGQSLNSGQLFDLIKNAAPPFGHDMGTYGLSDDDVWDLVKFLIEHLTDTDEYIDEFGDFIGDPVNGEIYYDNTCADCHGLDGTAINFGSEQDPEYIGGLARRNPWEFLHKVRGGHPGTAMPSFINLWWLDQLAADVSVYSQTLP